MRSILTGCDGSSQEKEKTTKKKWAWDELVRFRQAIATIGGLEVKKEKRRAEWSILQYHSIKTEWRICLTKHKFIMRGKVSRLSKCRWPAATTLGEQLLRRLAKKRQAHVGMDMQTKGLQVNCPKRGWMLIVEWRSSINQNYSDMEFRFPGREGKGQTAYLSSGAECTIHERWALPPSPVTYLTESTDHPTVPAPGVSKSHDLLNDPIT